VMTVSADYGDALPRLAQLAWAESGASIVVGCSADGVIGTADEAEDAPAISLLALALPGATLRPARITPGMVDDLREEPEALPDRLGIATEDVNGWILFANPLHMDTTGLVDLFARGFEGTTISGGLASPRQDDRHTWVILNGEAYRDGAVGIGIGGEWALHAVLSQGCEPIGEAWTITKAHDRWIDEISGKPAAQLLAETLRTVPDGERELVRRRVAIGFAANEYKDTFGRGDFLVRTITGFERGRGGLAIAGIPRVGQTVQFQLRDAETADHDLLAHLTRARADLAQRRPVAGILATCNGRGLTIFDEPDHDARAIERILGPLPLAGSFCAGEIGPVNGVAMIHGFTASLALIVPKEPEPWPV